MKFSNAEIEDISVRARLLQERLQSADTDAAFPAQDSELYARWRKYLHSDQAVNRRFSHLCENQPRRHRNPVIHGELLNAALAHARMDNADQIYATIGALPLPALGELLLPFVHTIRQSLERQTTVLNLLSAPLLDHACLSLLQLLCRYSSSVIVLEYRIFGGAGLFSAPGGGGNYRAFSAQMLQGGLKQTLFEYPVLTRWLLGACQQFETMMMALPAIAPALEGRRIEGLELYLSDQHEGKSVYAVTLEDGSSLHVKPRGCEIEEWLQQWIIRCDSTEHTPRLTMPKMRRLAGYTAVESVRHAPCCSQDEVAAFFERAGSWLCIFRLLHTSDIHCANIIAAGAHPVPVDVETIFQPDVPWHAACHPLFQTDFLPLPGREAGTPDFSAMGRTAGACLPHTQLTVRHQQDGISLESGAYHLPEYPSLPHWNGTVQNAADHIEFLVNGYRSTYEHICGNTAMSLESADGAPALKNQQTRYVFRHTGVYNRMQELLLQPECLKNGDFAGVELERLAARAWRGNQVDETLTPIVDAEIRALSEMDIPIFLSATDDCAICDANGTVLATYHGPPPLMRAIATRKAMSESELVNELAMIRTCFTQRKDHHAT